MLAFQTPYIPEALLRWDDCSMIGLMLTSALMGCRNRSALTKEVRQAPCVPGRMRQCKGIGWGVPWSKRAAVWRNASLGRQRRSTGWPRIGSLAAADTGCQQ
jgi:hypothetical protein